MTPPRRSGGDGGPRTPSAPKRSGDGRPGTAPKSKGRGEPTGKAPTARDFRAARAEGRNAERRSADGRSGDGRATEGRGGKPRGAATGAERRLAEKRGTSGGPRPARPAGGQPANSKAGGTVKARDEGPMRVQRALARAGVVSRRGADQAVADGRVQVNGVVATVGQIVDTARDRITLDGTPVETHVTAHRWIVLHKPAAVMTTRKDPQGRTTVFDLVEDVPGLVYVGRLDFMTEGVLLLTTDGTAAHALTHPSREVERTYVATVRGDAVSAVRQAREGVELEDGVVVPRDVQAHPLGARRWAFEITIAEGKTHEVRRICDTLGLEVERLVRTQFGPIRLGHLESGQARALTTAERTVIDALVSAR
ncbi:pseudouridine synthase [Gemmatimonas sp.]|uniref:pseudouridine synthase n=1 Tax=Gemmatimonas sp. TaxID=1962908 RepID=UPI0027BA72EF|nr:pseudouridine synthase [Gemmatimonas sp.]